MIAVEVNLSSVMEDGRLHVSGTANPHVAPL